MSKDTTAKDRASHVKELTDLVLGWVDECEVLKPDQVLDVTVRINRTQVGVYVNLIQYQGPTDVRLMKVADIGLTIRSGHCLRMSNIETVGDIEKTPKEDLLKIRYFTKRCLREIEDKLNELGVFPGWNSKSVT